MQDKVDSIITTFIDYKDQIEEYKQYLKAFNASLSVADTYFTLFVDFK